MLRTRAAGVSLWLVCLALQLGAVRNMWIEPRVPHDQIFRGVFEDPHGRPELALTECCGDEFFPGPGLDARGAIAVSPGMIAVFNLGGGGTFVVKTDESIPAPYVVFGTKRAAAGVEWLSDARRIDVGDAGLELVAWDGGQPWHADARWLAALSEHCGGADTRIIRVSVGTDHADVRLGSCPPATLRIVEGEPLLMAVVAGPSWGTVSREGTGYHVDTRVNTGVLIPLLGLAAISIGGLAAAHPGAAVAVSTVLLVVSFIVPLAAWLAYLVVALVVVIASTWRVSASIAPFRRRWMRTCIGFMSGAIVLLVVVVALQRAALSGLTERHWTEVGHDSGGRCRLVGYSPVDNAQLRDGGGISSILARCPACAGGLDVTARHGGRLDWMRRQVCSSEFSSGTNAVVAIGGDNDDMLWVQPGDYMRHAVAMLRFLTGVYARSVRPAALLGTIEAFAASAARAGDDQAAAVRAAAQCARDRGARFVLVHDLFIEDLTGGRSATRQALLERRRNAVAPDGRARVFVDALEAFPEMGVSWFNDMRHPSLVGHRKIAERVCEILKHAPAAAGDGRVS
jgi:hypothetical protein